MRTDPDPVPPAPAAGEPLGGRYLLGEQLGSGAGGVVYRAEDLRLARTVAVKLFRASDDPRQAARVDLEIATLSRLDHPGLVRALDAGTRAGERYVVLDLVEGQTLDRRLEGGPLAVPDAVRLVARVADILAYVHARGVVHRDVKPGNILLDGSGRPRLGDFGVARASGRPQSTEPLTATGCIVGTPRYMAPEQVRGEPVTGAADVYALGLVLLESLTGLPEYQGAGLECAIARLYRPPSVPAWLPDEVAAAVTAMTRQDPSRRPGAAQVARLLSPSPAPSPVPSPSSSPARLPSPSRSWSPAPSSGPGAVVVPDLVRLRGGPVRPGWHGRRRGLLVAGVALAVVAVPAGRVWDVIARPGGRAGSVSGTVRLDPPRSGRSAVTRSAVTSGGEQVTVRRPDGSHRGPKVRPGPVVPAAGPPDAPGESGEHGQAGPGHDNGPGDANGSGEG